MDEPAPETITAANPPTDGRFADDDEWLLTNGLGGFAMGTVGGHHLRRYHGLLIASARPPVARVLALHSMIGDLDIAGVRTPLWRHAFGEALTLHPEDTAPIDRCEIEPDRGVRWTREIGGVQCATTISMHRGRNGTSIRFDVRGLEQPARLSLRPLTPMRDFHELGSRHAVQPHAELPWPDTMHVRREQWLLALRCQEGAWTIDPQWWHDFAYRHDRDRGQAWQEDVFSPGVLVVNFEPGGSGRVTIEAELNEPLTELNITPTREPKAPSSREGARLVAAADQFIVRRRVGETWCISILAGFPWFADWGRDTMIALPGLLLTTGRLDEAKSALLAFGQHIERGLVPNVFDDSGSGAHYNSVDASLWFIRAVRLLWQPYRYIENDLLDPCRKIIHAYRTGTDFGIRMDDDGLIVAGDASTQLTWMDAKRDGVTFTPRYGKAVEINALWHHALVAMSQMTRDGDERGAMIKLAGRTARSFRQQFWCPERDCLHDCLLPTEDGFVGDGRVRPNQVFAVSLDPSPLTLQQRESIVNVAYEQLLTPFGMRTLTPDDEQYKGRYEGDLFQRDSAYHQGTVWPWLIGAYCEAVLRVGEFSDEAKDEVRDVIQPLIDELDRGCIDQIAEVYDGDEPHRADGCPAQAWSVAEVLRVLGMVEEE